MINNHPTEEVRNAPENLNLIEKEHHSEEQKEPEKKINVHWSIATPTAAYYANPNADTTFG